MGTEFSPKDSFFDPRRLPLSFLRNYLEQSKISDDVQLGKSAISSGIFIRVTVVMFRQKIADTVISR